MPGMRVLHTYICSIWQIQLCESLFTQSGFIRVPVISTEGRNLHGPGGSLPSVEMTVLSAEMTALLVEVTALLVGMTALLNVRKAVVGWIRRQP
jgi:hypothetical protein